MFRPQTFHLAQRSHLTKTAKWPRCLVAHLCCSPLVSEFYRSLSRGYVCQSLSLPQADWKNSLQVLKPLLSKLANPSVVTSEDIPPIISKNPSIATPLLISLLTSPNRASSRAQSMCFNVIIHLPPTLNSFDVVGSLLRDKTPIFLGTASAPTTVGEAIKTETLGYFLHESISRLDAVEVEEREGLISEDIFAKGVQNVGDLFRLISGVAKPSRICCSCAGFITRCSNWLFSTPQLRTESTLLRWHISLFAIPASKTQPRYIGFWSRVPFDPFLSWRSAVKAS